MSKQPVLLCCADLHLTEKPPLARAVEGVDWLDVQKEYLDQLDYLARKYQVSIAMAGDIFDKPTCSTRFMNWVLGHWPLSHVYAIPGNHDLPCHRYDDIQDCGYWTLVEAKKLANVCPGFPVEISGHTPVRLHGFPCGYEVKPLEKTDGLALEVALVHAYIWTKNTGYVGAPEEQSLFHTSPKLVGYDAVVYGDNHKGFLKTVGGCSVLNCGGFMRRKSDEKDYQPQVGLLYSDGSIERIPLDCSEDKFVEVDPITLAALEHIVADGFIDALQTLGDQVINFERIVRTRLEDWGIKVPNEVKTIILRCLEKANN